MQTDISTTIIGRCQLCCLRNLPEPFEQIGSTEQSLPRRLKLALKRWLNPSMKRKLKKISNDWMDAFSRLTGRGKAPPIPLKNIPTIKFKAGDKVRVKSEEGIRTTLGQWKELKGCGFFPEMQQYCGTVQRVLKPVERFVDERDYRIKKAKGVYLLEGIICQGIELYGRCDRACFYFWREEWLESCE
jgi:hypothetical protein